VVISIMADKQRGQTQLIEHQMIRKFEALCTNLHGPTVLPNTSDPNSEEDAQLG
jgi:hypothetical protein